MSRRTKGECADIISHVEKKYLMLRFLICDGVIIETSKQTGLDRQTVRFKMVEFGYLSEGGGRTDLFNKDYAEFCKKRSKKIKLKFEFEIKAD